MISPKIRGSSAGAYITTGTCNVHIGYRAGVGATVSDHDIFIGTCSGRQDSSNGCPITGYNIAIGYKAGFELGDGVSNDPHSNIMIGCCAGQSWNNSAGAGDHNVFIGSKSGNVTSGGCNAAVCMCAGSGSGGSHNADLGLRRDMIVGEIIM